MGSANAVDGIGLDDPVSHIPLCLSPLVGLHAVLCILLLEPMVPSKQTRGVG